MMFMNSTLKARNIIGNKFKTDLNKYAFLMDFRM